MTWRGTVEVTGRSAVPQRIEVVVSGSPLGVLDSFDAIDEMEFYHDQDSIVGMLGNKAALIIGLNDSLEIRPCEPAGG